MQPSAKYCDQTVVCHDVERGILDDGHQSQNLPEAGIIALKVANQNIFEDTFDHFFDKCFQRGGIHQTCGSSIEISGQGVQCGSQLQNGLKQLFDGRNQIVIVAAVGGQSDVFQFRTKGNRLSDGVTQLLEEGSICLEVWRSIQAQFDQQRREVLRRKENLQGRKG